MAVDDESSNESEEEVRVTLLPLLRPTLYSLFFTTQEEEFYSPGSLELLEARRRIAEYSLPRLDFTNDW